MSKKGTSKEQPLASGTIDSAIEKEKVEKDLMITMAKLNAGCCVFEFQILKGQFSGVKHKVSKTEDKLARQSLIDSFNALNVHLACIDDVFKHAGLEVTSETNIDQLRLNELTLLYHVDSVKIEGHSNGIESVILMGSKRINGAFGHMDKTSPRIMLDVLSSYKLYEDLLECVETLENEVFLYRDGNFDTPLEEEEEEKPKADPAQMSIVTDDEDDDFEELAKKAGSKLSTSFDSDEV